MQARLTESDLKAMVDRIQSPDCSESDRDELRRRITLDSPLFLKLQLPSDESVIWCASDPTFHRSSQYGIAVTDKAVYLSSPFLIFFGPWRRYPISSIRSAAFRDSRWAPRLLLDVSDKTISFRTPYDGYQEEMDYDRKHLARAATLVTELIASR